MALTIPFSRPVRNPLYAVTRHAAFVLNVAFNYIKGRRFALRLQQNEGAEEKLVEVKQTGSMPKETNSGKKQEEL